MKGIKKIFLAFFVVFCFLLITSTVLFRMAFSGKWVKNIIQWRVSKYTGGKSQIKSVSMDFSGIVLNNISVFYNDNSILNIEKIKISPNLFPFPRKQIALNKILIFNLVMESKNKFEKNVFKNKFSTKHAIIINSLILRNGLVSFSNLKIEKIDLDIKNASLSNTFPIDLIFTINDTNCRLNSKEALIKENNEEIFVSGNLANILGSNKFNYDLNIKGNRILFNKVFLSNLYKRKIAAFSENEIDLQVSGDSENIQIENLPH